MTDVKTYKVTSTRTIVEMPIETLKAVLGVDNILALYRVGDRIEVVTESQ